MRRNGFVHIGFHRKNDKARPIRAVPTLNKIRSLSLSIYIAKGEIITTDMFFDFIYIYFKIVYIIHARIRKIKYLSRDYNLHIFLVHYRYIYIYEYIIVYTFI